jgi:DNA-binding MarR family transcriptional regulator
MDRPYYDVDSFAPRISLGYLVRRVNKLSIARIEATFDGSEISFTQWIVLALVSSGIATTCAELSRNMDHNSGAMTRVVDQLEERGLLVRRRDDGDRRISNLSITEAGSRTVHELVGRVVDVWNDILRDFDRDEITQLIATLGKLLARLDSPEPQPEA